jgi:hypothetical protein
MKVRHGLLTQDPRRGKERLQLSLGLAGLPPCLLGEDEPIFSTLDSIPPGV